MPWKTKKYSTAIKLLIFCILLCGCNQESNTTLLPYYQDAGFTPIWLDDEAVELNNFHHIRPFTLVNQLGDTITELDLDEQIIIADFFFTSCPGICPKMTENMAILQEKFRDEPSVRLLSHSVTPKYDSVPILAEYASAKGVDADNWWLLTGERSEIYELGRKFYFVEEDLGSTRDIDEFLHTENFVLLDGQRRIRGIYNGLNLASITQLAEDVKVLLHEMRMDKPPTI
ncbi:SCO family protein [Lewinellaceae bacterium SD302]|nr:SCO family protein [Lewinellaceae bacterium SD302]